MRVSTGVPGFDTLVNGGLLKDRLYIISGPPGSGKTTFCAQFATKGAIDDERTLYLSMHETQEELVNDMSSFEFGFEKAIASGQVKFLNVLDGDAQRLLSTSSRGSRDVSANIDNFSNKIVSIVESKGVDRLIIDSTMLLEYYFSDDLDALVTFLTKLKRTDATVLLISEMTDPTSYSDAHYLAHGVVFFHNYLEAGEMVRGIQLIKMRGTPIDCDIREIEFTDRGLRVDPETKIHS
ncbi:RAD55 family ATPase [Natrialbaceae archaeon GCM10025810]|uniref:RAD55 family ATPase n=1 Tax=Halovalidus salilacus TaxID=3075124 RepID=UPI0036065A19